jgi:hypothetical protein
MAELGDELLVALDRKNAARFGAICRELHLSEDLKTSTCKHLVEMVSEDDLNQAEAAVNALRFSGLVLEKEVYQGLLKAAETIFHEQALAELAASEMNRAPGPRRSAPKQVRVLESMILAFIRIGGEKGMAFVEKVENQFTGAPLAKRISRWKMGQ